jgi:hypothetical protein
MYHIHSAHRWPDNSGTMARIEWEIDTAKSTGRIIGLAELDRMLDDAGTTQGAYVLCNAVYSAVVTPETVAAVIGNVWQFSYPNGPGPDGWVHMFRLAGYTHNCRPAERPSGPLRLYRGAPAEERCGLSWTPVRWVAEHYAHHQGGFGPVGDRSMHGAVWWADVEPDRLLACSIVTNEIEYVVDPEGLEPWQWTTAANVSS